MAASNLPAGRYGIAIGLAAAAVACRWLLDPWLPGGQISLVALPAVTAAAVWFGGYRAGIVTAVLGYAACDYLFTDGVGFGPYTSVDVIRLLAVALSTTIIIVFGEGARIVAAVRQRARTDEAEKKTHERFRQLADSAPVLIWTSGTDKKCTWFNRQWLDFVGRPIEREIGDGWAENVHPDDLQRRMQTYVRAFDARRPFSMEYRLRRADGEYRWLLDTGITTQGPDGAFTGYIGSCVDITDRSRAERALQATQERFSRFMRHLPGLAWIKDLQGRYVFANDAAVIAFGMPRDALYGRTDADIFPAEVAAAFSANDRNALANGGVGVQAVEVLEHEDGVLHHSLVSKFPIPGPGGETAWVGGIAIDITERKRAEDALEEADRRKTDFLATLSHELRNPLAPIRNSLELVRRAGTDPAAISRSLDVMDRQTSHMVRLVDDLLDVNRITRDRLELRRDRINLGDVLRQSIETCAELIDRGGHSIDLSLPEAPVYLDADPIRLVQVFGNLLNNACRYSARPGCIRISVHLTGSNVVVSVADDGMGIPTDSLERIFEMFAQVDSGNGHAPGSLGIGLTLVKRLVELHGGRVEAKSDGLGCGSEFEVTLPTSTAKIVDRVAEAPADVAAPHPLRVLVVDDNTDSAESLATLLTFGGHETATAHDGPEALALAERFRPHVAILDVGLPTFSGHEVCRQLRTLPWGRDVFIVALTGWGQEEDRRKSIEAGFDDHFVKPLDSDKLLSRLRSVPAPRR